MKINNKAFDKHGKLLDMNKLTKNAAGDGVSKESFDVVYAHVGEVNDNNMSLNADSLVVTREKYPLLYEHSDDRVEGVLGYIETDGKPNDKGEFIGVVHFYETEQGRHARQLWVDGVISELSISYYITDYEWVETPEDEWFMRILRAKLAEVSIVSVGADSYTGEVDKEIIEDIIEDEKDIIEDEKDIIEDEERELAQAKLNALKIAVLNGYKV